MVASGDPFPFFETKKRKCCSSYVGGQVLFCPSITRELREQSLSQKELGRALPTLERLYARAGLIISHTGYQVGLRKILRVKIFGRVNLAA